MREQGTAKEEEVDGGGARPCFSISPSPSLSVLALPPPVLHPPLSSAATSPPWFRFSVEEAGCCCLPYLAARLGCGSACVRPEGVRRVACDAAPRPAGRRAPPPDLYPPFLVTCTHSLSVSWLLRAELVHAKVAESPPHVAAAKRSTFSAAAAPAQQRNGRSQKAVLPSLDGVQCTSAVGCCGAALDRCGLLSSSCFPQAASRRSYNVDSRRLAWLLQRSSSLWSFLPRNPSSSPHRCPLRLARCGAGGTRFLSPSTAPPPLPVRLRGGAACGAQQSNSTFSFLPCSPLRYLLGTSTAVRRTTAHLSPQQRP